MKTKIVLLAAMMAGATFGAKAQQSTANFDKKIEQLFTAMNLEESFLQSANMSADQTIAGAPQLAGKKEEARAFFVKYMSYAACKNDLLKLYAKYYTEAEIETLTAFYKTSAGKKQQTILPRIQAESTAILNNNLQAHAEELNKLLPPATR